ncbi:MAG TPA: VOC family protein [Myxococcota bacterium]|jgi:PhnB protein
MTTTIQPYLNFDGQAEAAMKFYAEALGGKLEIITFGESPMPVEPEHKKRVMHSSLTTDTWKFMASDTMPGQPAKKAGNVSMSLSFTEANEQQRCWDRLAAGANITMPLGEQFFGKFGMLTDKFGVPWMLDLNKAPAK